MVTHNISTPRPGRAYVGGYTIVAATDGFQLFLLLSDYDGGWRIRVSRLSRISVATLLEVLTIEFTSQCLAQVTGYRCGRFFRFMLTIDRKLTAPGLMQDRWVIRPRSWRLQPDAEGTDRWIF